MHCNLRQPDVASVVLGFNYEANGSPTYKFNSSAPFGFGDPDFLSGMRNLAKSNKPRLR